MTDPKPRKTTSRAVSAGRKATTTPVAAPADAEQSAPDLHLVADAPEVDKLPAGAVRVPLADGSVVVPDSDDWPSSANEDFFHGLYRTWASKILSDADFAFWVAIDPTNRQVNEFCRAMNEARGTGNGLSVLRTAARLGIS